MSKLTKPASIEDDAFRSAKWDELTSGRDFSQADVPTLALLVSWYQVIERCMDDIGANAACRWPARTALATLRRCRSSRP